MKVSTGKPSMAGGLLIFFCFPLMKIVMNSNFRRLLSAFSRVGSFSLGFFMSIWILAAYLSRGVYRRFMSADQSSVQRTPPSLRPSKPSALRLRQTFLNVPYYAALLRQIQRTSFASSQPGADASLFRLRPIRASQHVLVQACGSSQVFEHRRWQQSWLRFWFVLSQHRHQLLHRPARSAAHALR